MGRSDEKASAPQGARPQDGGEFEVLASGTFPRGSVSVLYRPGRSTLTPSARTVIDRTWRAYRRTSRKAGIKVYNGALFRLDSFRKNDGCLQLMLSDTDFRECIGTAGTEFRSAFPDLPRANPLAVSVALVTGDGKIVIEKRTRIDSRRRAYHVIAGYMERERDGRKPHPFNTLEREVREELGVDLDGARLFATGLVRTLYGSELCFRSRAVFSFDDLLKIQAGSATDSEIETLLAVEDAPSAMADFLTSHPGDLAPPGRACLLLYGREVYGEKWYETARGRY